MKLFKAIISFFKLIFFPRKTLRLYFAQKKLKKVNKLTFKSANLLKKVILIEMRQYLSFGKNSKFIPPDYKSRVRTVKYIEGKFGTSMEKLNVKLNYDLQFV